MSLCLLLPCLSHGACSWLLQLRLSRAFVFQLTATVVLLCFSDAEAKNGSVREVLWSHGRNATAVRLNPTWKGRMLLPYANRIAQATYTFNGTQVPPLFSVLTHCLRCLRVVSLSLETLYRIESESNRNRIDLSLEPLSNQSLESIARINLSNLSRTSLFIWLPLSLSLLSSIYLSASMLSL